MQITEDLTKCNIDCNVTVENINTSENLDSISEIVSDKEVIILDGKEEKVKKADNNYPVGQTPYYQQQVGGQPVYFEGVS